MGKTSFFVVLIIAVLTGARMAAAATQPSTEPPIETYAGAGPYVQTQPYRDTDPIVLPTPVIFFDNRLLYVRWTRIGLYVYGKQNWGVSLTAQPRPWGYRAKDSTLLSGMAERRPGWEAGVALGGKNRLGFAELTYFHDVSDHSNGSLIRLEIGKTISRGHWYHVPSVYVIRYSDALLNYYYGVRPQESIAQRPAYEAKAGINFALQHFFMLEMSKQWFLSANLRMDYLASEITHSPIVDDRWMGSAMASLLYKFNF